MARTPDIIQRLAGRLPISVEDMTRFASALEVLVDEALDEDGRAELMTFGTLSLSDGRREFTPHPSLLRGEAEDSNES